MSEVPEMEMEVPEVPVLEAPEVLEVPEMQVPEGEVLEVLEGLAAGCRCRR